jgi:DNA mismatch endonuclease, patch repair protein
MSKQLPCRASCYVSKIEGPRKYGPSLSSAYQCRPADRMSGGIIVRRGACWFHTHMDFLTPEERSKRMSLIRGQNTKPEMLVRRYLHGLGLRYKLHDRSLPGTPDLVFKSRRVVVFVHGCFWHGHHCRMGKLPQSRTDYWWPKLARNKQRDARSARSLRRLGWRVLVIRECRITEGRLDQIYRSIIAGD